MVKIRKKRYSKKSSINKTGEHKTKCQKQILNNISAYENIFEELDKGRSLSNAENIEKELLEKVDNKQNTPTDLDEKLNQIKSTNATDNDNKNKKICFKRNTIIKLRRKNLLMKRLQNLQKNKYKKAYKYLQTKNKKNKIIIKNEDDSISSTTKETPSPIMKNVIKNDIKSNLEDKKIDEKKSLIKNGSSSLNENKKGDKKYISKTEKAEDKKINILNEENININNNEDNMSLSLSENNNNNNEQAHPQNGGNNNIINNNEDNMSLSLSENNNNNEQFHPQNLGNNINNNEDNISISSSNSNPNVLIYSENQDNSEENGTQNNNQNLTENNVVNLDNEENNSLNDDMENNNINIDGMDDYVTFLNNLPDEEINNDGDNGDVLQNPDFGNLNSNK